MAETLGAVLVAEIGTQITRVTLIDQVDGESRLIGRAETPSSIELPFQNALYSVLEAVAQISEATGRLLLREGQLITPQTSERDGINGLVVTTSAAGPLALVITAIAGDVSARSAIHASRSTYTSLLQVVTLDDAVGHVAAERSEQSWIERQVQTLLSLKPDAILITGGLEGGAVDAVNRLAHIVGLTALRISVDSSGQQRQDLAARPVIYAGNSNAREPVVEALSDRAEISVVENLRPALDRERLEPTQQELSRLYERLILPRLSGIAALRRMSNTAIRTVCDVQGLMTRFLAERYQRRVLVADVGAAASSLFYAAPGVYHLATLASCGVSYGLSGVISGNELTDLSRWLHVPITDEDLRHRLLNRQIRPQLLPASAADLDLELAVAREAMTQTFNALRDEYAADDYDWLILSGGVLAHVPHPGMALLAALDALQNAGTSTQALCDVHLDTLGLVQVSGALASLDPDAAVCVADRDLLMNTPLATVLTPIGAGQEGDVAVEVELQTIGGSTQTLTVRHGEILRLPLAPRRRGRLQVRPAAGVRLGNNEPGAELATDADAMRGSALGIVIDARGRPPALAEDPARRRVQIWRWLSALGAVKGPYPYGDPQIEEEAAPTREPATHAPLPPPPEPVRVPAEVTREQPVIVGGGEVVSGGQSSGKRISLADLAAQEQAQAQSREEHPIDRGLDALRQTVEPPKKRGLFGKRK
ncbi:MAG: hypothetical protein HC822_03250 [Oscillochloris sp.]|nr:hypothetical protein [Oscillochloris sp.]